jgi:catechol 2,3-dioxygenase-like lactoylglutathione lyase family enzyme
MLVGTGDAPRMLRFYERCGFTVSHRVENFFLDHYDHPVLDCSE